MVEHLSISAALRLLMRCHRALDAEGFIRLAVPDLEEEARTYLDHRATGDVAAATRFLERLHFVHQPSGPMLHRLASRAFHRQHEWMYDVDTLSDLLHRAGFQRIIRRAFRQGQTPDLSIIEQRPDSLFVEAFKV